VGQLELPLRGRSSYTYSTPGTYVITATVFGGCFEGGTWTVDVDGGGGGGTGIGGDGQTVATKESTCGAIKAMYR